MKPIRIVACALVALAFLAMGASGASAAYIQADEYPAEVKGEREGEVHIFGLEGGLSVKCETATFTAELPEPREVVEVLPSYEKCTASGVAATVTMEGCKYRLDANTTDVDIVCPAGKVIKIVTGTCEVQIGSQNGLEKEEYVNHEAEPETVTVESEAKSIKYTKTKDGFLCPLSGLGEKSDGTYTGDSLAKAFHGAQVGFFIGAAVPTKLCAEEIKVCPAGQTYAANTNIKTHANTAELRFHWTGSPDSVMSCKTWKLEGQTQAKEEAPRLKMTGGATFESCEIISGGAGTCTVGMSLGTSTLQAVGNGKEGWWKFSPGSLLTISACQTKGMSQCEFVQNEPTVTVVGGKAGGFTINANVNFPFSKGKVGDVCPTSVTWKASYVMNEEMGVPQNVFVTN
jgi:hypothetical protein